MQILTVIVLALAISACSQPDTPTAELVPSIDARVALSEYEGQYEYEHGTTLIMVRGPDDKLLYASINGAHYPLRPVSRDVFLNAGDIEVLFVRGDDGEIVGYRENRSPDVEGNPLFRILHKNKRLPPFSGSSCSSHRNPGG